MKLLIQMGQHITRAWWWSKLYCVYRPLLCDEQKCCFIIGRWWRTTKEWRTVAWNKVMMMTGLVLLLEILEKPWNWKHIFKCTGKALEYNKNSLNSWNTPWICLKKSDYIMKINFSEKYLKSFNFAGILTLCGKMLEICGHFRIDYKMRLWTFAGKRHNYQNIAPMKQPLKIKLNFVLKM